MAVQLIRKVRDRQPTSHVGIDWANPLTKGLAFAHIASLAGVNLVNGNKAIQSTGFSYSASGNGRNIYYNKVTRAEFSPNGLNTSGNDLTIISIWSASPNNYLSVDVNATILSCRTGGNQGWGYGKQSAVAGGSTGNLTRQSLVFNGVAVYDEGNYTIESYVDTVVAVRVKNGFVSFFRFGKRSSDDVSVGTSSAGSNLVLGASGPYSENVTPWANNEFLTLAFTRGLSDAEIFELTENIKAPFQVFEPETIPLFFSTVTAQYARPTSDVSAGTWTASSGSDLFAMLDETVANDTDYIVTTGASTCEVALGTMSDPSSSSGHIVRYRISATSGGITVRLRQGTTTIATWTHASAPTSLTTYAQTLTSGEADSITDYTALRLQFEAT